MPRRVLLLVLVGGLGLIAWAGVLVARDQHFRTELREAKRELRKQRTDQAKERLTRLARRWPGQGEVEYWLGTCELAGGSADAALEAWSRVPARAPEAGLAALASGRLAMERFRYSLAERCLERAILERGANGDEARWLLARLHWLTGRHDEYRQFLRREVERSRDPFANLRLLWTTEHDGYPVEGMREEINQARRVAPKDDRVWLALADLATRTGHLDEAAEYLTRCEGACPGDPAVWRASPVEQESTAALARLSKTEAQFDAGTGTLADSLDVGGSLKNDKPSGPHAAIIPKFVDEAESRGLAFTFDNGRTDQCQLPETMSGGVGLLDFDGDGWLDIYAIQGGKFPPPPGPAPFGDRLFRNRGDGRFVDVTCASGLANHPQVATRDGGGSYLSSSDHRLHFGLAHTEVVDQVDVTWPSGRHDTYRARATNNGYPIVEGNSAVSRLPDFKRATNGR